MRYVDCHAHLEDPIFDKDRAKVIEECRKQDILIIDCPGAPDTNRRALELFRKFDNVKLCLGMYPTVAAEISEKDFWEELKFIESQASKLVGVGEIGIDFYWLKDDDKRLLEQQRFKEIIWLANKLKLPLNVHSRAAEEETIALLAKSAHVPVMLHSFGGDTEVAKIGIKEGFYFGIPPLIVRSNKHRRLVAALPVDRILTETDSPYQGPTKERNDPRNIPLVVEEIAKIKKLDTEEVRHQLLENAKKVFRLS
jgi:TatD DNase family protein